MTGRAGGKSGNGAGGGAGRGAGRGSGHGAGDQGEVEGVDLGWLSDIDDARDELIDLEAASGRARPGDRKGDRRPGRPKGAGNRKTKEFEKFYEQQGFMDPLVAMGRWLTADPVSLQAWFIRHERALKAIGQQTGKAVPSLMEIIREQQAVAAQLAPYLHGKKPVELQIIDERLPQLILNLGTDQLALGHKITDQRALSAGQVVDAEPTEKGNKNNDL